MGEVWKARYTRLADPHEKSVLHGHPLGIAVYLTDAHLRFRQDLSRDFRAECYYLLLFWSLDGKLELMLLEPETSDSKGHR